VTRPRLRDLLPVPLAAPETKALRRARLRIAAVAIAAGLATLFFAELRGVVGRLALPLLVGLYAFLAVQVPVWLKVKNAADDAFLMKGTSADG
jgi:uncharacterized membrane protein YgaE (UPF0421/DUF939 family)